MIRQHWKRASFHFFKSEVAAVLEIHPATLSHYCKKNSIRLDGFNLAELLEFIERYRREHEKK